MSEQVIEFAAGDGLELNLINVRGSSPPAKGPVLLVGDRAARDTFPTIVEELERSL